jgi:hypothetical protein
MNQSDLVIRALELIRLPDENQTDAMRRLAAALQKSERTLWRWKREHTQMGAADFRSLAKLLEGEASRLRKAPLAKHHRILAIECRAAADRGKRPAANWAGTARDPLVRLLAAAELLRRRARGDSLEEIGRSVGVTRERVRQIYEQLDQKGYLDRAASAMKAE